MYIVYKIPHSFLYHYTAADHRLNKTERVLLLDNYPTVPGVIAAIRGTAARSYCDNLPNGDSESDYCPGRSYVTRGNYICASALQDQVGIGCGG